MSERVFTGKFWDEWDSEVFVEDFVEDVEGSINYCA